MSTNREVVMGVMDTIRWALEAEGIDNSGEHLGYATTEAWVDGRVIRVVVSTPRKPYFDPNAVTDERDQ